MKINELINNFEIWTSNEERKLLEKLKTPVAIASLNEQDQHRIQSLIRKSLIIKIGQTNPYVVINGYKN